MSRPPKTLTIDARPRGPRGPFAAERVQGRTVLEHVVDVAESVRGESFPVTIHARPDELGRVASWLAGRPASRFVLAFGPPPEGAPVLRTDRLYDVAQLRNVIHRGKDPELAVIWRLDGPNALDGAEDELTRRQTFQPLGRYWALGPARRLARALAPTRVHPNALTLGALALVIGASAVVASPWHGWGANVVTALALALCLVLDTADGHLARLQGTASEFGRWLDGWLDEVGDMTLHGAIAWAAFARSGSAGWLVVGIVYAAGKYLFVVGTTSLASEAAFPATRLFLHRRPSALQNAVRLAGHADVRLHLWIALAALGRLDAALAAYAAYFPARALAIAVRKAVRRG
jgi:phosphatidylglycerophosphate synthase